MCFNDKRKRNWIRKEDLVFDRVRPSGQVGYDGVGRHTSTVVGTCLSYQFFIHLQLWVYENFFQKVGKCVKKNQHFLSQ